LLQVSTDPPRATVAVDGSPRGISPLSVAGLPPGPHVVTVRASGGTVERKVDVPAGATASVHLVLPAPAPVSALGWLQAAAAAPLTILEGGRLLGTTAVPRLALSPGEHVLDFTSDDLGFRTQQRVRVEAGETTSVRVDLPLGPISVHSRGPRCGSTASALARPRSATSCARWAATT
jgi:hypothetical protein